MQRWWKVQYVCSAAALKWNHFHKSYYNSEMSAYKATFFKNKEEKVL